MQNGTPWTRPSKHRQTCYLNYKPLAMHQLQQPTSDPKKKNSNNRHLTLKKTATTDMITERRSQTYILAQYLHRAQSFRPQSFKQTQTHLQSENWSNCEVRHLNYSDTDRPDITELRTETLLSTSSTKQQCFWVHYVTGIWGCSSITGPLKPSTV